VGLLRRHPNLYCDTAARTIPGISRVEGSGWEQFLQFGNTLLQDKVMVGLSRGTLGMDPKERDCRVTKLPLPKERVIEKWLYGNAKRVLPGLD